MKHRFCTALLAVLLLLLSLVIGHLALAQSGGNYDVEWQVIGTAGDQFASGGSYQLGFTLGQDQEPLISAGGSYQIVQEYWAGSGFPPTAVKLLRFWTEARSDTLVVSWETASEVDTLGFHLYRSETGEPGSFGRLNAELIPAQAGGSPGGALYEWADTSVVRGQSYFYLLEDVDVHGQATPHGPVRGALSRLIYYLPLTVKGH